MMFPSLHLCVALVVIPSLELFWGSWNMRLSNQYPRVLRARACCCSVRTNVGGPNTGVGNGLPVGRQDDMEW